MAPFHGDSSCSGLPSSSGTRSCPGSAAWPSRRRPDVADSGANPYAQNVNVNLTNTNANNIDFFGASTFTNSLFASTTRGTVTVEAGATLHLIGGTVNASTLQQTATGGHVEIDGTVTTS